MNLSSLELSVAILAGVAVTGVAGYNAWQAWGLRRRMRGRAVPAAAPAPAAAPEGEVPDAPHPGTTTRDEPVFGDPDVAAAVMAEPEIPAAPPAWVDDDVVGEPVLDSRVDCAVVFEFRQPLSGERLTLAAQRLRHAGSKPVAFDASPVLPQSAAVAAAEVGGGVAVATRGEAAARVWESPRPERSYSALRVGLLLANRHGAVTALEFNEFVTGLQLVGDQLDMLIEAPDEREALSRARALDEFCAAQDAQLMIHVDTPDALSVDDLVAAAHDAGLSERGNNRWVRIGARGAVLFSLALGERPNRLSLLLDMPRTPMDEGAWGALVDCAQACIARFGGIVVDDSGRPLGPTQLDAIASQLDHRAATLRAAGIAPGSAVALRLFN